MRRALWLLLAVSVGLNAGLLYGRIADRSGPAGSGVATDRLPAAGTADRPAGAPPPGRPPGRGDRRPPPRSPAAVVRDHLDGMTRHLDLSAEQQAAIREILAAAMPEMLEYQRRSDEAHRRLSDAFAAPAFDPGRFRELVADASAARRHADSLSAVMLVGEAAVLTPAQRIRYAEVAPTVHADPRRTPPPPPSPGAR